jgi:hypothetical protein
MVVLVDGAVRAVVSGAIAAAGQSPDETVVHRKAMPLTAASQDCRFWAM